MTNNTQIPDTRARINDNLYLDIKWARVFHASKSAKKAQFSGDLCTNDGVKICTINRLCVLHTIDRKTNEPTIFIGSMSEELPKGDTIYAVTWFPDAKNGGADLEARSSFSEQCIKAIAAFQEKENEAIQKAHAYRNESHPALKPLADVASKLQIVK